METVQLCPKCGFSPELHSPIWGCQTVTKPGPWTNPAHMRVRTATAMENLVGDLLTDRKIKKYTESGWYNEEMKQARHERAAKKAKKFKKSNLVERDGRLIYSPW